MKFQNCSSLFFVVLISLICVQAHVIPEANNLETGPLEINIFKRQSTDAGSDTIPESGSTESPPANTIVPIIDTTEASDTSTSKPTPTVTPNVEPIAVVTTPTPCNCDTTTKATPRTTTRVPVVKMDHNPKDGSFQPGYQKTETGPSGTSIVAAAFGKNRTSPENYGDSQVLYASVGDTKHAFGVNYNFEVGLRKASSHTIVKPVNVTTIAPATNATVNTTVITVKDATVNITTVSTGNATANGTTTPAPVVKGSEYSTKLLTVGGEFGSFAAMAKASLFDAVIKPGRVGIQAGMNLDTGYKLEDGVEFKVLGVGGYVGKRGIQACVIFCFGILW